MALFDPDNGQYNDAAFGLDTHAAINNEPSLFDSAIGVITKGVPLTGLAIVNSFANTAIEVGNFFSPDGQKSKLLTIEDEVGRGDMLDYYNAHEQGIEAAGLVLGSFIPGTAAIKALKLAQAGRSTSILTRATSIFSGPKQRIIDGALQEINAGEAALYGGLNADKYKAIALGFGDQALQALAFEVATAATMKASPLLDKDSFGDVVNNMFFGVLVGGGVGGVLEGVGIRAAFNKGMVAADKATKAQESATYLGKGGYFAGDRAAALIKSIDDIPTPDNLLGTKKFEATKQTAILNAKKQLGELVESEDKELTNSMFDVLYKMKNEGGMDKEEMYNYLARLSKVSRITEETPDIGGGTLFYANRFAPEKKAGWNQLVTSAPEKDADYSLAYRLKPYATDVNIAHASEMVEGPSGLSAPRYTSAKEAFDNGADIYIDPKLRIYVNENAPNIERSARPGEARPLTRKEEVSYRATGQLPTDSNPLLGGSVTLNTITGAIAERATAVVGDFGSVRLLDKGIEYGGKTSIQSLDNVITADTSTIDANARYVWWGKRGIQRGDTIAQSDVAGLEQLFRESTAAKNFDDFRSSLEKRGISVADQELPRSQDELLNMIRGGKDDLISSIMQKEPKLGADEVAIRANVPEDYLANALRAQEPKEYMIDPTQHERVNHVRLSYDIGNIYQQDGQILRGMIDLQYRINLIKDVAKSTTAKFFGPDFDQFLVSGADSSNASIAGVGPKAFSASNADYNTLAQQMERIGKSVTTFSTKRMSEISNRLASVTNAIRSDEGAAAELGFFRAARQRTGEQYVFLPPELSAQHFAGKLQEGERVAVLKKSLSTDKRSGEVSWDKDLLPEGTISGEAANRGEKGTYSYYTLSKKVSDFEQANMEINNARLQARNNWYSAQGLNRNFAMDTLYTPPIDTTKYSHIALVKMKEGVGLSDDGVSVITAESAKDLEQKIAAIDSNTYSVFTKGDIKKYHEVLGDYQYDRNFANSQVNSMMLRKGILNNIFPDTRAESIIKDYVDWHSKQELRLTRDHVELGNAQLFAELSAMGERFTSAETSKTGFVGSLLGRTAPNPYSDYIKTALGISEKENYRLWHEANEKLEAFFSTAFRAAKDSFTAARKGLMPYEEASELSKKFGLGNPYEAASSAIRAYYDVANKLPPERYLSKFVSTANSALSATVIRLDFFQSLINAVSTPVLLLSEANSARTAQLMSTELPDGSGRMIPAVSKLLYASVDNWFNKAVRDEWMPAYKNLGIVRDRSSDYFEMIDKLTLPYGRFTESESLKKLQAGVDLAAKLTGSELSEEFARFIAADTARQIFQAVGHEGKQLTDNISTFVNRVHGNYVASQRPIAFQGPIGQAIGLFQTYQFNLLNQLFRYVENGEGKTIAILAGMQTTLFGMQGLPGFAAINNHIIGNAANNPSHKDLYSTVPNFFDKKLGDYLLYGSLSNWMQTGLYGRGDINPRQITILPTNPLDYPAISGGVRFLGNIYDTAVKIAGGGSVPASMLLGLEHNGLSRPLAGLGQMVQGFSTTSKGQLVATTSKPGDPTSGLIDMYNIANYSRLLGARPLDEAIAMDALYRSTLYKAKDTARIEKLGESIKTTMYGGGSPSSDEVSDFASSYAKNGGNITRFGSYMMGLSSQSNVSAANKIFKQLSDPHSQQMMMQMGGVPLPDFRNSTDIAAEAASGQR